LPDGTFGPNGAVLVPDPPPPAVPSDAFAQMEFDDAGRLVAAGPAPAWTGSSAAVVVRRYNPGGTADTTFATAGEARVVVGDADPRATDLAVAPGRGIVVSARSYSGTPRLATAAVVRLTPAGAPDPSFGGDGVATAPGRAPASVGISRIAELPDGKYVATGDLNGSVLVARFNRDGSLDTSFDSDGWATPTVGLSGGPSSLEVLPDGKLLLGSGRSASFNRIGGFELARLNPDGTPDLTFGEGGAVFTPIQPNSTSVITSIAVQPDGKIVAAGATGQRLLPPNLLTTARYNPNGSLDPTYGGGGVVVTDAGQLQGYNTDVALLGDGSVLVGATVGGLVPNTVSMWEFVRYSPTGAPDLSFGNVFNRPGVMTFAPGDMGGTLADLFALPDGGFLAGGTAYFSGSPSTTLDFAVARFRPDGTPDPAFGGGDGVATAGFRPTYTNSQALGMDRQADGRIVIGGTTRTPADANDHFAAARFTADGALDPSYGQAGRSVVPLGPVNGQNMILTSYGEALFSGFASGPRQVLARLLGDTPARLTVSDRRVFYNDSTFDGSDPRTTPADLAAVAPDKQALRPGQAASFANVSSYAKGLNGVVIELTGVPPADLLPGDFVFRTSRGGTAPWVAAPQPNWVTPVAATGPAGSPATPYALTWGDNAIRNGWLEVTVKANARTGLAAPDVFTFGKYRPGGARRVHLRQPGRGHGRDAAAGGRGRLPRHAARDGEGADRPRQSLRLRPRRARGRSRLGDRAEERGAGLSRDRTAARVRRDGPCGATAAAPPHVATAAVRRLNVPFRTCSRAPSFSCEEKQRALVFVVEENPRRSRPAS
jgi:uncharacterized delta-60 repeat protein